MTMKLSGSHVSSSLTLTCVPKIVVTTFTDNILKVFSFNRIDLKTYPEDLEVPASTTLYELNHTYRCYNDLTEEGPFDKGSLIILTDFYKLYKKNASGNVLEDPSVPGTWVREPDLTWNTTVTVVKSKTTSTIVKFNSGPTDYQSYPEGTNSQELGFMEHPYPYKMRTTPVLNCITEPDPIIPNVTLNLDTLEIPWVPNESYTIEVTDSFVKHSYGEQYGSPAFTTAFISNQPPYMVSWEPNNAPETGNIQQARLTYIRRIKKGTADIQLFKAPATLVKNFTPTDPDVEILNAIPQGENEPASIIVSINVREYLEANQSYYILVDEDAFKDYDNFSNVAITDTNTITFSATMQNYIDWLPGAVTATKNNRYVKLIYPYYAEPNPNSSGTIRFYDSDNTLLRTFLPTGSGVTYEPTSPSLPDYPYSTTITFDVLGLLAEDKTYYMVVDTGVFQDADEFGNTSIEDVNELRYSTDDLVFPGLKSNILAMTLLNDIGGRLRSTLAILNSETYEYVIGNLIRLGYSNMTNSILLTPLYNRIRGVKNNNYYSKFTVPATFTNVTKPLSSSMTPVTTVNSRALVYRLINATYTIDYTGITPQAVSINGTRFAAGQFNDPQGSLYENEVHVYSLDTGNLVRTFTKPVETPVLEYFGNSISLVTLGGTNYIAINALFVSQPYGLPTGKIYLYNVDTGALLYTIQANPNYWYEEIYATYQFILAVTSTSAGSQIRVYNIGDGSQVGVLNVAAPYDTLSTNGRLIAVPGDFFVQVYEYPSLSIVHSIIPNPVTYSIGSTAMYLNFLAVSAPMQDNLYDSKLYSRGKVHVYNLIEEELSFNSTTTVSISNNNFTIPNHNITGTIYAKYSNNGNANIGGLIDGQIYRVRRNSDDVFDLELNGYTVDLTSTSSGIHKFFVYRKIPRYVIENPDAELGFGNHLEINDNHVIVSGYSGIDGRPNKTYFFAKDTGVLQYITETDDQYDLSSFNNDSIVSVPNSLKVFKNL